MSAIKPNLLNPTTATIAQYDAPSTAMDHRRRSPVTVVVKDAGFQIKCQVKWAADFFSNLTEPSKIGADEQQDGYIIVRTQDLETLGKTLKRGDRITKLGDQDVVLFILRLEYGSHYGGKFRLVKLWFQDRKGRDG